MIWWISTAKISFKYLLNSNSLQSFLKFSFSFKISSEMNCKVCGSADFVTNDGITYCTECQSQIEETQTEVAVEHTLSRDIGSSGPKKTPTQKKQEEYDDWITAEGFNHILHMQVSSLIKLGASPKLKNTVLYIWSKYLQKCEIAFRIDYQAKNGKPLLGTVPFKRDLKILYGNKKTSNSKQKRPKKGDDELSENSCVDDSSADNTDATSDNNTDSSLSTESKCTKVKYSSHARKMMRKKRLTRKSRTMKVFNMNLPKALSICYLGLLYTEDQLLLSDFIRFVYEEKIPYLNIVDKLSSRLKLHRGDRLTFLTYTVPDAYTILKTSREIMQFLKLPEYKEPSVFFAATHLVRDLNLPGDILPIVKKLIERYKEKISHYASGPKVEKIPPEYQALASILVAMKMLFLLDDKFEIEHNEVMKKLNALHPDRRYFEWNQWKEHSAVKEYLFLSEKLSYSASNNLDSLSANLIISKYPFTRLKPKSSDDRPNPQDRVPIKHKIKELLSDVVHIPSSNPNVPTSFPLRKAVKCYIEEWRTLPMFKETRDIDFTLLQKDFFSCSLFFNPLQFDKIEDEASYLLMTSLYLPETSVNLTSKYYLPVTYHHEVICTTSNYWFVSCSEKTCGLTDITSAWLDKLPNSFKWLLNLFSKYVHCNNRTLYKEVVEMEKILLLQMRQVKKNARIKNKINVDF